MTSKIILPRGGIPIRQDLSGGVPRTARLTGAITAQAPVVAAAPIISSAITYPTRSTIPISTKYAGRIPIASSITRGIRGGGGGVAVRVPAPRTVAPLNLQNTATGGVFGGINGGAGVSATPPVAAPLSIGGISSSVTSAGSGIMNTIGSVIPLAIKIIIAVIVIKIIWWLIKGRRR